QIEFLRGQISQLGQQVPASDPQGSLQAPGIPPPLASVPPPVAAVTPTAPTVVAAPNPPASVGGQVNWAVNNPATNPNVSAAPPAPAASRPTSRRCRPPCTARRGDRTPTPPPPPWARAPGPTATTSRARGGPAPPCSAS